MVLPMPCAGSAGTRKPDGGSRKRFSFCVTLTSTPPIPSNPWAEPITLSELRPTTMPKPAKPPKPLQPISELLDKLMAWKPDLAERSARCNLYFAHLDGTCRPSPPSGRTAEAKQPGGTANGALEPLEWQTPNAQFLLRQSLSQITPRAASGSLAKR